MVSTPTTILRFQYNLETFIYITFHTFDTMANTNNSSKKPLVRGKRKKKTLMKTTKRKKSQSSSMSKPLTTESSVNINESHDEHESDAPESTDNEEEDMTSPSKNEITTTPNSSSPLKKNKAISRHLFYENFKVSYANTKRIQLKYPTINEIEIYIKILQGLPLTTEIEKKYSRLQRQWLEESITFLNKMGIQFLLSGSNLCS